MRITLKPIGRGNWRTQTLDLVGPWLTPLSFRLGERIPLGGAWFRVVGIAL